MGIEVNDRGSLYGVGQFYGYDDQGSQTSWVATLYNFHLTTHGMMIIDLLAPSTQAMIGTLFVRRTNQGGLVGQIALGPHGAQRFTISWHKISNQ